MAWGSTFLDIIEERGPFKPIVKIVKHQFSQWGNSPTFTACTHPNLITSDLGIIDGSIQMNGYDLNTQTWTVSGGGFQFMTDSNPCAWLTRGHVLRLYLGFDGISESAFEILDWGVVRSITAHGGIKLLTGAASQGPWVISCDPFFAAFQNRPSNQPLKANLFYSSDALMAGHRANLTATYVSGTHDFDVDDASEFEWQTGGVGAVKVTDDDDTTGYMIYDSITIGGGSGGSDRLNITEDDNFGVTIVDIASGRQVIEVPLMFGHPSFIFRRILASTGIGTNGVYDDYPLSWGIGLDDAYIDHTDASDYYLASEAMGDGLEMYIIPDPAPQNCLPYFISCFSPGGWFPVITQGKFSLRCALAPDAVVPVPALTIYDRDIDDGPDAISFEAFASDSPVLYSSLYVLTGNPETAVVLDSASDVGALPALYSVTLDYSQTNTGIFWKDDSGVQAALNIATIRNRVFPWLSQIPQKYTLRCNGYRLYQLAVGSIVELTTGQDSAGLYARLVERDGTFPRGRWALVTGWAPDPMRGRITLKLSIMPTFTEEVPP